MFSLYDVSRGCGCVPCGSGPIGRQLIGQRRRQGAASPLGSQALNCRCRASQAKCHLGHRERQVERQAGIVDRPPASVATCFARCACCAPTRVGLPLGAGLATSASCGFPCFLWRHDSTIHPHTYYSTRMRLSGVFLSLPGGFCLQGLRDASASRSGQPGDLHSTEDLREADLWAELVTADGRPVQPTLQDLFHR